jgi:hypothetical protein
MISELFDDWGSCNGDCDQGRKPCNCKQKRKMIDPPSGWKYGFPKEIPEHVDDTRAWLIENGYPKEEIDKLGDSFFVRGWYEEDK